MTTNDKPATLPAVAPKLRKVIRVEDTLFGEDRKVWTHVEALDADFLMEPFTREVRERLIASGVQVDALVIEMNLDLVAKGLSLIVHGWRDGEGDEHPLRSSGGKLIPYSPENLARLLQVNEIAAALLEASKALAVKVELVEQGN